MLFKNARLFLLGSDDFPFEAKVAAARALNEALEQGWEGFEIGAHFPLASIAEAHAAAEDGAGSGRVVLRLGEWGTHDGDPRPGPRPDAKAASMRPGQQDSGSAV